MGDVGEAGQITWYRTFAILAAAFARGAIVGMRSVPTLLFGLNRAVDRMRRDLQREAQVSANS